MTCLRNDVVLLPIPFTDLTSRKVRPAIVVGRKGTDLFVVPVLSVLSNTDFLLQEWQAGLNVPSGVKAQLATVEERLLVKDKRNKRHAVSTARQFAAFFRLWRRHITR